MGRSKGIPSSSIGGASDDGIHGPAGTAVFRPVRSALKTARCEVLFIPSHQSAGMPLDRFIYKPAQSESGATTNSTFTRTRWADPQRFPQAGNRIVQNHSRAAMAPGSSDPNTTRSHRALYLVILAFASAHNDITGGGVKAASKPDAVLVTALGGSGHFPILLGTPSPRSPTVLTDDVARTMARRRAARILHRCVPRRSARPRGDARPLEGVQVGPPARTVYSAGTYSVLDAQAGGCDGLLGIKPGGQAAPPAPAVDTDHRGYPPTQRADVGINERSCCGDPAALGDPQHPETRFRASARSACLLAADAKRKMPQPRPSTTSTSAQAQTPDVPRVSRLRYPASTETVIRLLNNLTRARSSILLRFADSCWLSSGAIFRNSARIGGAIPACRGHQTAVVPG